MNKVEPLCKPPRSAIIQSGFGAADYIDSYRVETKIESSVDQFLNALFQLPGWILALLKIRNAAVSSFGLKADVNLSLEEKRYEIGSRAALFTVIDRNEDEIVMGEEDKHLNFRTSVLKIAEGKKTGVYVTTIVKYNNAWGRIYFFFVKPFHRAILKSLLKRNI